MRQFSAFMAKETQITEACRKYLEYFEQYSRPMVRAGFYNSTEDFLRDCLKDFAQRKVDECEEIVLGFEKQFISWEKFNDAIKNVATPEQEDIALEWEWARDCRESWQALLIQLS